MNRQAHVLGWAAVVIGLSGSGGVAAQAVPELAFEVASVKLSPNDGAPEGVSLQPDGSARFTRFHVRTLITMAYRSEGIQRFDQLLGAPSWLSVDRFDVVAKVGGDSGVRSGPSQLSAMLRSLLRDRFQLRVHSETRDLPAYGLVLARRDGTLGPALRESTLDCATSEAVAKSDSEQWCGIRATGGVIIGRAVSPGLLAGNLSGYPTVDRFVTDRTGLTGRYDFRLEYSPAFLQPGDAAGLAGPSLFTALTEQLGLRLQPELITAPVLVIDRVERPTPD